MITLDRQSLLASVPGAATLASIERALEADGLTLGILPTEETVADWLARGASGAASSFSDPADHLVAGITATLTTGRRLEVRPSPRRAVGPDLIALLVGAHGRFGSIEHAWLRVHPRGTPRVAHPLPAVDLDPPPGGEEAALLDAIAREL